LNTTRTILEDLPADRQLAEARRNVKMFVLPHEHAQPMSDSDVPDHLISNEMVVRYRALAPPIAAVIPEFQTIINEIERTYVLGLFFSALSAACVAIERLLNLARIELHQYHPKIKTLWGKGASNSWDENIDALAHWDYLDATFASELKELYREVRCGYLHSRPIADMSTDALRVATAAYKLLGMFLGFPRDLFKFTSQIECLNPSDPRFLAFYRQHLRTELEQRGAGLSGSG
jgi:hypothetical protein